MSWGVRLTDSYMVVGLNHRALTTGGSITVSNMVSTLTTSLDMVALLHTNNNRFHCLAHSNTDKLETGCTYSNTSPNILSDFNDIFVMP